MKVKFIDRGLYWDDHSASYVLFLSDNVIFYPYHHKDNDVLWYNEDCHVLGLEDALAQIFGSLEHVGNLDEEGFIGGVEGSLFSGERFRIGIPKIKRSQYQRHNGLS